MKCMASSGRLGRNRSLCVWIAMLNGAPGVIIPGLMPFWQQEGVSIEQVWLLQGCFAVTLGLCTVPFGLLADVRGRKACLFMGITLSALGDVAYLLGHDFWAFLVAEVCMGAGVALVSGADSALLYDTLKALGPEEEKRFARLAGLGASGCFILTALGNLGHGWVASFGERVPFCVSAGCALVQLALLALVTEPVVDKEPRLVGFGELPRVLAFSLRPGSAQLWLIAAWSVVAVGTWLAVWFYPLSFQLAGLTPGQQGAVWAFYNCVAGLAAFAARRHTAGTSVASSFIVFVGLTAGAHVLFGTVVAAWAFLFGALHQVVRGAAPVVFGRALNELVPSTMRATVLSVQGACATLAYGCVNLRLGACIELFGFQAVLVVISVACVATAMLVLSIRQEGS